MKTRTHRKLIRKIALGLAVVAVAAPTAQAGSFTDPAGNSVPMTRGVGATPDDWAGHKGIVADEYVRPAPAENVRPVSAPEAVNEYVRPAPAENVRPINAPQAIDEYVRPAPADNTRPATPLPAVQPKGFDWTDAGIGAGFAFGLILLASGMALVARRHRQTSAAAF
jgi:hypothetical protein